MSGDLFRTVCTGCRRGLGPGFEPFCSACGAMADVEYDLAAVQLRDSPNPYVHFGGLLPVSDAGLLPQDAAFTPTVHATRLGAALGMDHLYLKDETCLPTGTTKDRMAAVALAYLYECGVRRFATSSTGNSSTAYREAISRIPELVLYLFTASQFLSRVQGPPGGEQVVDFVLKDASFVEAFDAARDFAERNGITSERGFFNPGRREGLKLAWLEAADQVGRPIDWYVQAVSSAMGVYGVFNGAVQLRDMGRADRLPRLLCVQQETCAPMATAWREGAEEIGAEHIVARPTGIAAAILRGNPSRVYPHVRRIVRASHGTFAAVSEEAIREARRLVEDLEGISPCFAAAAAVAGVVQLRRRGELPPGDTVLINLTGREREGPTALARAGWLQRSEREWVAAAVPA